jgi:DNA-binding transcriptional regulator YdaS (Cro superfamily)
MDKTNTSAIQRAADEVGVPAIANACGISVQAVYKWVRKGQAPAERCEAISRATGGRVPTIDLLPASLRAAVLPH